LLLWSQAWKELSGTSACSSGFRANLRKGNVYPCWDLETGERRLEVGKEQRRNSRNKAQFDIISCGASFLNRARNSRCTAITDLDTSKRSTQKPLLLRRHLGYWSRGPEVSMRSELLVAHGKLGQFPLLRVYVVCPWRLKKNTFFINF
jgi:hypothetical protein